VAYAASGGNGGLSASAPAVPRRSMLTSEISARVAVGISANSVLIQGLVGSYGALSVLGTASVDRRMAG